MGNCQSRLCCATSDGAKEDNNIESRGCQKIACEGKKPTENVPSSLPATATKWSDMSTAQKRMAELREFYHSIDPSEHFKQAQMIVDRNKREMEMLGQNVRTEKGKRSKRRKSSDDEDEPSHRYSPVAAHRDPQNANSMEGENSVAKQRSSWWKGLYHKITKPRDQAGPSTMEKYFPEASTSGERPDGSLLFSPGSESDSSDNDSSSDDRSPTPAAERRAKRRSLRQRLRQRIKEKREARARNASPPSNSRERGADAVSIDSTELNEMIRRMREEFRADLEAANDNQEDNASECSELARIREELRAATDAYIQSFELRPPPPRNYSSTPSAADEEYLPPRNYSSTPPTADEGYLASDEYQSQESVFSVTPDPPRPKPAPKRMRNDSVEGFVSCSDEDEGAQDLSGQLRTSTPAAQSQQSASSGRRMQNVFRNAFQELLRRARRSSGMRVTPEPFPPGSAPRGNSLFPGGFLSGLQKKFTKPGTGKVTSIMVQPCEEFQQYNFDQPSLLQEEEPVNRSGSIDLSSSLTSDDSTELSSHASDTFRAGARPADFGGT